MCSWRGNVVFVLWLCGLWLCVSGVCFRRLHLYVRQREEAWTIWIDIDVCASVALWEFIIIIIATIWWRPKTYTCVCCDDVNKSPRKNGFKNRSVSVVTRGCLRSSVHTVTAAAPLPLLPPPPPVHEYLAQRQKPIRHAAHWKDAMTYMNGVKCVPHVEIRSCSGSKHHRQHRCRLSTHRSVISLACIWDSWSIPRPW